MIAETEDTSGPAGVVLIVTNFVSTNVTRATSIAKPLPLASPSDWLDAAVGSTTAAAPAALI
jgi:hypothetical protein